MSAGPRERALQVLRPVIDRAGSAYLAGTTRPDAVQVARRLTDVGFRVTVGYWNDASDPVARVAEESAACLADLADLADGTAQVAVKAPALHLDAAVVAELAATAAVQGVGLLFDAHAPGEADATLELAAAARARGARTGIAVPVRWARSLVDVRGASGLGVRLVKGQWPDDAPGGIPSTAGDAALRAAFLSVLAQCSGPVSVATHDPVLAAAAVQQARAAGQECELELLLGLPARRLLDTARRDDVPVRFYVPYGRPGIGYPLSSTLRRPRLAASLATAVVRGRANRPARLAEALAARPTS